MLASLTLGGIETWLVHMLRQRDRFAVNHEILLTKEEPGGYEDEVRRMGVPIHKLPLRRSKLAWLRAFKAFLEEDGPFDAVHSHVYLFSAPVLAVAKAAGVHARIAHCHTARSRGADHRTLRHRLRRAMAIGWLKRVATRRIGISDAAIEEIAGSSWRSHGNASVLLYGFDFSRNRGAGERAAALRERLAIPEDAPVIGHVGRFEAVKNHAFLLDAFAACLGHRPEARLVLVGTGPLRDTIAARAEELEIAEQVHFVGTSGDVPAFMAMFDLLVLPSFSEGLGIVCVEAQAAGTRALVSSGVPAEVEILPGAVESLPLDAGASAWGEAMARIATAPKPDPGDWLAQVEASRFGIRRCVDELDGIYGCEFDRDSTVCAPNTSEDRPLRVLIASSIYPPAIGGPAIQADLFARRLARRGVEVHVLTYGPPSDDVDAVRVEYLNPCGGRGAFASLRRHFSIIRQVARLFSCFRPDVVQMQTAGGLLPLTVGFFARLSAIPSWVKFPSDPVRSLQAESAGAEQKSVICKVRLRTAAVKLLSKLIFRTFRFVWATTPTVAEKLASEWGVSPERIVVAPNLVELNGLAREQPMDKLPSGERLRLLLVARLDGIKGVDIAIRALAKLDLPHSTLRVIGDGSEKYVAYLRSLADELGVSDSIEWAGRISRERLDQEYWKADLLLVPSRYEAFGVVIIEAMAAGLPIIASNVGGIPYVVQDGKCARLVDPDDAAALAQAIRDIANDPDEMARLTQQGLKRAREFDADAGVDKWLKVYRAWSVDRTKPLAHPGMM